MFVKIDGTTLSPKNTAKKSFSYQAKAFISSILIRRICLWCPIMKKRRLLPATKFVMINGKTLNPKNDGKKSFSCKNHSINIMFPNEENAFL